MKSRRHVNLDVRYRLIYQQALERERLIIQLADRERDRAASERAQAAKLEREKKLLLKLKNELNLRVVKRANRIA